MIKSTLKNQRWNAKLEILLYGPGFPPNKLWSEPIQDLALKYGGFVLFLNIGGIRPLWAKVKHN